MASQDQTAHHAGEDKGRTEEETRDKVAKARALAAEAREKAGLTAEGARVKAAVRAEAAKEKTSETAQTAKDHAIEGKEKTAGFLQQTGETVTNVTRGAAEAVKSTLGIGQDGKDKETDAAEKDGSSY